MPTEEARLRKLYQMELLDTPTEKDFDEIVMLASQIAKAPISLITLVDSDRQWFKANRGLEATSTEREVAVCNYTIQQNDLFEVDNMTSDKRFARNRLVTEGIKMRYYAGMPLTTSDGFKLGALCVIDTKVRPRLSEEQASALRILANQAMKQIELRVRNRELASLKEINSRIIQMMDDDVEAATQQAAPVKATVSRNGAAVVSAVEAMPVETMGFNAHTLRNILDWGRLQRKAISAVPDTTCLVKALVMSCGVEIAVEASAKGNSMQYELDEEACIQVNAEALSFVIRNLLHNANKYTSEGSITVRHFSTPGTPQASARHYISITDTGAGIQPFDLKMFADGNELQKKACTNGEMGSGNGLLLCLNVLQQLGGKLHLESKVGEYTTAIVII
jgi:signal transduction histidine kinase